MTGATTGSDQRRPVWLDCDPGHDDALAIVLAGFSAKLQLLGISTVAGNQTVEKVTENALRFLEVAGLGHIDVAQGQAKPLIRHRAVLCPEIHGDSGLDGPRGGALLSRSSSSALPTKAVPYMFQRISAAHSASGRRVQLVCTGALTNAALLLILYPEVVAMIEITIMGGCLGIGNTHPVAEFNIQTDPEAAKVVFEAGAPLAMVPLEVTHTVLATPERLQQICPMDSGAPGPLAATSFRRLIRDLLTFFASTYKEVFDFESPPLHDPCAVAYVIAPEIFEVQHMRVDIETSSSLTAGQTVCDVWGHSRLPVNVAVARSVDNVAFWTLMNDALAAADAVSPVNTPGQGLHLTAADLK